MPQDSTGHSLPPSLEEFLDHLIEFKFTDSEPFPSFIKEVKNDLGPLLVKAINLDLYQSLNPEQRQEFDQLVDEDPEPSRIQAYLEANIPDQDQIVAQTLIKFRSNYLHSNP
jgi:hypothetical protein